MAEQAVSRSFMPGQTNCGPASYILSSAQKVQLLPFPDSASVYLTPPLDMKSDVPVSDVLGFTNASETSE